MRNIPMALAIVGLIVGSANGVVTSTTQHGTGSHDLDGLISATDLIAGQIGVEQPGDTGWHPANGDPLDKLPAFTDSIGVRATGLTGLMNDYPGVGNPAKLVRYDLGGAKNIAAVHILTGNDGGDGRIFSTTVVRYSTDGGASFSDLGYFQSDPSGTINNAGSTPQYRSTMLAITDDGGGALLSGVTHIQFNLYAVDNTGGQMRDPFDGVNPFTGLDDGLTAAFVSPLVWELDVIEVPEPASLLLLGLGGLFLRRRRA